MADILKLDLKRKYRYLYNPTPRAVTTVEVPAFQFLMIDGAGDPNTSQAFQAAANALYGVAYTLKFMVKKGSLAIDYPVMALEGLWWTDDMAAFSLARKEDWKWTIMIMQPEFITREMVADATQQVITRKDLPALAQLRFETYSEGLCAQIMHLGPYATEAPTIEKLHAYIAENGYQRHGYHHEIYLSDPHKSAPARIKTILRQPIA